LTARKYGDKRTWFPIQPLIDFLGPYTVDDMQHHVFTKEYNLADMADFADCSTRSISRYRRIGRIPIDIADKVCCSQGVHPLAIWPVEYTQWLEGTYDGRMGRDIEEVEAEPIQPEPDQSVRSRNTKDPACHPDQNGGKLPSRWR
jgi:hypothetical protein